MNAIVVFIKIPLSLCHSNESPMRFNIKIQYAFIFLLVLMSCNRTKDRELMSRLNQWDLQLDANPNGVLDSLEHVNTSNLPRSLQAYHSLLLTIARDKTFYDFTSDSGITQAVKYYSNSNSESDNYVRSLIYQAIVRTRMGITDSTVYIPLRRAKSTFEGMKKQNPQTGYMLNYFMGNTYLDNDDATSAEKYFNDALKYAQIKNDSLYIFDARMALYWNNISRNELAEAKTNLDSIKTFLELFPDKDMYILNAQSYYYQIINEPYNALECDKRQLALIKKQDIDFDPSKLYYSISRKYISLNQLDSARVYGKIALEHNTSLNKKENFLFYENLADIETVQNNFELASDYRKEALEGYKSSINDRIGSQIKEVEKKYDLSVAENKLLKARQRSIFWALATTIVILLFVVAIVLNRRVRQATEQKMLILRHEADRRELEAKLLADDANKMGWLISIYSYLSERLSNLQDNFSDLSQRYISSNPKVYEKMNSILYDTSLELKDMYSETHPNDETFTLYTGLNIESAANFNDNEKMMLMLLASKASNKQIATFMNSTIESVRARKSQLKRKMINHGLAIEKFF